MLDTIEALFAPGKLRRNEIVLTPSVVPHRPARFSWVPRPIWNYSAVVLLHVRLLWAIHRIRRRKLILVHSFSTAILGAIWPILRPLRNSLLFIVNHNLQFAHNRSLERVILRFLWRRGFRFALFEGSEGLAELGIQPRPSQLLILPLPVPQASAPRSRAQRRSGRAMVGVVGRLRAEKQIDDVLSRLVAASVRGEIRVDLLLGCPDPEVLERWGRVGVRTVNTTAYQSYLDALGTCDVLVANYHASQYYFRSSGVLADAAALGVPVVCPDFPIFRKQVTEPVPVGVTFKDLNELVPAIPRALDLKLRAHENFELWAAARSAEAIGRRLDDFASTAYRRRSPRYGKAAVARLTGKA